eukprot:10446630-Ditylum_brightwellii.AAC.1
MNARKVEDVAPLAEMFVGKEQFKQYVFMSSAGVCIASEEMPHVEMDPTDPQTGRPICIPGYGQHLTGLGHVYDLSVTFCNVIGRDQFTTGQVYNIQNTQAITFD